MELFFSLCIGLGLSVSCGFRVFVPLLGMSLASHAGLVTLAPGFEWLSTSTNPSLKYFLAEIIQVT